MVRGWTDLKKRLGPDRRCYAFFHNSMPRVPLLLLHVALTSEITESITDIVDRSPRDAKIDVNLSEKTTAMFYSITSTQEGLQVRVFIVTVKYNKIVLILKVCGARFSFLLVNTEL